MVRQSAPGVLWQLEFAIENNSGDLMKYKQAFRASLNPDRESEDTFEFGPPADEKALSDLETSIGAPVPGELRELLAEFNGIWDSDGDAYYFALEEMPRAAEYYREWDWPTDLLMDCSKNILYICQENGLATMWGIVVKPFGPFEYGQIVAFDHDLIMDAEEADELFNVPYSSLLDLVAAEYKASE